MFPSFTPTSQLPLSHLHDHNGNNNFSNSSPHLATKYNLTAAEFDFDFEDDFDHHRSLIYDPISYQEDPLPAADDFTTKEQNQEIIKEDQDQYLIHDQAAGSSSHNSFNNLFVHPPNNFHKQEQNQEIIKEDQDQYLIHDQAAGSSSHNSFNNLFVHPPNNFHIDEEVMRESSRAHGVGSKFALRMKTKLEVVYDGYKWRKYGKKKVKSSSYPRNYFKCSITGCKVKKRIERDSNDSSYVITTYDGVHNHDPSS